MNICVFASGGGSNFNSLIVARRNNIFTSDIKLLITNNSKCGAVDIARSNKIAYTHISRKIFPMLSDEEYQGIFLKKLKEYNIELIVLAGYMKMIEPLIIAHYRNRIINIHPALLPSFGGKGMYGINVHKAVIESGVKESGLTIHLVDENYDRGKILFQVSVPVEETDDENTLQKKILNLEHKHYSNVIRDIEKGSIKLDD